MSRYLEITAIQEPFPIGNDENDRVMFSSNYDFQVEAPVDQFEEEVGRLIFDAGLGAFGSSMLMGNRTPAAGAGPWINLINTGGVAPLETQTGEKIRRPSLQIIVRASNYQVARTRALAIWQLLDGKRDVIVTA